MRENGFWRSGDGNGDIVRRLRALVEALPERGAVTLTREDLLDWLDATPADPEPAAVSAPTEPPPWRERIWTVPAAMPLSPAEAAEAASKSREHVYRSVRAGYLPARRTDGGWAIEAGAVREWLSRGEPG